MSSILRISEAASLALHTGVLLAEAERRLSAGQMARQMQVSEAHLAKVLQRLARAELVRSVRGPHGGFELARPAAQITLQELYEAVDGPLASDECLMSTARCNRDRCIFGSLLADVGRLVEEHFSRTRLSDLVEAVGVGSRPEPTNDEAHLNLWP